MPVPLGDLAQQLRIDLLRRCSAAVKAGVSEAEIAQAVTDVLGGHLAALAPAEADGLAAAIAGRELPLAIESARALLATPPWE